MTIKDFRQSVLEDSHFIDAANYQLQLEQCRASISDGQVKVLFFEDYMCNPSHALRNCFAFLGVDERFEYRQVEHSKNSYDNREGDTLVLVALKKSSVHQRLKKLLPTVLIGKLMPLLQ